MSELSTLLTESAARLFADAPATHGGVMNRPAWDAAVEAGFHRLLLSEDSGGVGDEFDAASAVALQAGAHAPSMPLVETIVANWCLQNTGLTPLDSPAIVVFARDIGGTVKDGVLTWTTAFTVPWPNETQVLVLGPDFIAPLSPLPPGNPGLSLAGDIVLSVPPSTTGVRVNTAPAQIYDKAFALMALLKASMIVGAMETVLDMSIDYANTRVQFGRPIGKFQAIQHMLAQMSGEVAAAAAAVQSAAALFGTDKGLWATAIAKGIASEAVQLVSTHAHQSHGAIGYTEEFSLQRFTRRMWIWRDEAGSDSYWYDRIGAAAFANNENGLWSSITAGAKLSP
jgi:acyl-CoA dehydrogenase